MGAALLKTPDKLESILRALVLQVGEPYKLGICVKIRMLETQEETVSLVKRLCTTGIVGLTIHCRTVPMRPRERAIRDHLPSVARVCRDAGVACLANGDVANRREALQLIEMYGVDGCMIATAAESNPSCFGTGDLLHWSQIAREYVETAVEYDNPFPNTKYCLLKLLPGKSGVHSMIQKAKSMEEIKRLLGVLAAEREERKCEPHLETTEHRAVMAQ